MTQPEFDVIVVGGGPVGLFLGCRLAQLGLKFCVLERQLTRLPHSRAIGIHPPALERLETVGLSKRMLGRGVKIRGGVAFAGRRRLGSLSFASCPEPYPFVLSLPQCETEAMLEQRLYELAPGALRRGLRLSGLETSERQATLFVNDQTGTDRTRLTARYTVGCDGKESALRRLAGIAFEGRTYPDSYVMGDFADTTDLGDQAGLYFTTEGLVESFPLPGGLRRWVVKTPFYLKSPGAAQVTRLISERTGTDISPESCTMLSSFGIQTYLAQTFAGDRVLLAGDAAHVLSPMGGQGMNLGWLDAYEAAETLAAPNPETLKRYALSRRSAARKCARRALFNTRMGRESPFDPLRNALAVVVTRSPLARLFARQFTMRGL